MTFCTRRTVVSALFAMPLAGLAQQYPHKAIRVVVPAAAGGVSDNITRVVTTEMQRILGQSFVVENIGGAAGNIGTERALKAAPDGYTLGGLTTVQTAAVATRENRVLDITRESESIVVMTRSCYALVVPSSLGVKTLQEFIALAKANPGKFAYGSAGPGSGHHLMGEMFKVAAGVDLAHIPYKGEQPATTDLLGGRIQMMMHTSAGQFVESGRMVALAVTSAEPWPFLPGVPTLNSFFPDVIYHGWSGLFVPRGTSKEIVTALNAAANEALKTERVRTALTKMGVVPVGGSPSELVNQMARDITSFRRVVQQQKIVIED